MDPDSTPFRTPAGDRTWAILGACALGIAAASVEFAAVRWVPLIASLGDAWPRPTRVFEDYARPIAPWAALAGAALLGALAWRGHRRTPADGLVALCVALAWTCAALWALSLPFDGCGGPLEPRACASPVRPQVPR